MFNLLQVASNLPQSAPGQSRLDKNFLRGTVGPYSLADTDPSAGSPTETLLRLLLPLSNKVYLTFQSSNELPRQVSVRNIHRIAQSVGATGGVYKGQGRNQHELMTRAY